MRGSARIWALTVAVVLGGALLLKGFGARTLDDPTASIHNPAPRGLMLLASWLTGRGAAVTERRGLESAHQQAPAGSLLLVPPPEAAGFTDDEVKQLLGEVEQGASLLVLCDEKGPRNDRLRPLLTAIAATCEEPDHDVTATVRVQRALGTLPGFAQNLSVRGAGRLGDAVDGGTVPAWQDEEGHDVVQRRALGAGHVTVVGSASVLTNDGLIDGENAAFAWSLLVDARDTASASVLRLIVDERHHVARSSDVLVRALDRGPGPKTGLLALLLLVPLTLLSLAPRRGEPPGDDAEQPATDARSRVHALTSLMSRLPPPTEPPDERSS